MQKLYAQLNEAQWHNGPVHITGQKGTGKKTCADILTACTSGRPPLQIFIYPEGEAPSDNNAFHIVLPPLSERGGDILDLADYFLHTIAHESRKRTPRFTRDTEDVLMRYDWPGNVTQLKSCIESLLQTYDAPVLSPDIIERALDSGHAQPAPKPLAEIEKNAIEAAISHCGGNIPRAAALLRISPSTIYRKKMTWEEE